MALLRRRPRIRTPARFTRAQTFFHSGREILPARRLEKEHALVGERGPQTEDVDVEALGAGQIARLECQVSEHGQPRIRGLTSVIVRSSAAIISGTVPTEKSSTKCSTPAAT